MSYDLVIVGGGLGGSTLGKVMAEHGANVLVLERTLQFQDRVRGENMHPWGVREACILGIYQLLLESCAREIRWFSAYSGLERVLQRDLFETTPNQAGELVFHHPEMQQTLLDAARQAGAEVRRGATVIDVVSGGRPAVTVQMRGQRETIRARLVVGADGRGSGIRTRAGFAVNRAPQKLLVAGVLMKGGNLPDGEVIWVPYYREGKAVILFSLGEGRIRAYLITRADDMNHPRLSGAAHVNDFISGCIGCGVAREWLEGCVPIGPLAQFDGADVWVEHPYQNGVVLIGDAATASDPTWGSGLSLTLKDVRILRDQLLAHEDWDVAAYAYAAEHDVIYEKFHQIENWYAQLMFDVGPNADERRERAFSTTRQPIPDIIGLGPDSPHDEVARRNFFGEEDPGE